MLERNAQCHNDIYIHKHYNCVTCKIILVNILKKYQNNTPTYVLLINYIMFFLFLFDIFICMILAQILLVVIALVIIDDNNILVKL